MQLVERAINGVELPDYEGVPDSGASTRSSAITAGSTRSTA